MRCSNCEEKLDSDWLISELISDLMVTYKTKKAVKLFLDKEFDWSLDNVCDVCQHTYELQSAEDQKDVYDALETYRSPL